MTTTTWNTDAGDGLWETGGNWTNGVPTLLKDAVIIGSGPVGTNEGGLECKTLDTSGYTGTVSLNNLHVYGNVTLSAGTVIDRALYMIKTGTLNTNGGSINTLFLGDDGYGSEGEIITLGSDVAITHQMYVYICTLAMGSHVLTLTQDTVCDYGAGFFVGSTAGITWSAGGKVVLITNGANTFRNGACTIRDSRAYDIVATLPPIEVSGGGRILHIVQPKFSTLTVGAIAGYVLADPTWFPDGVQLFQSDGDVSFACPVRCINPDDDSIIGLDGATLEIGGNFVSTSGASFPGASADFFLNVVGSAVSHHTAFAHCDASGGTEIDATDACTDSDNNTHVDFGSPPPAGNTTRGFFTLAG